MAFSANNAMLSQQQRPFLSIDVPKLPPKSRHEIYNQHRNNFRSSTTSRSKRGKASGRIVSLTAASTADRDGLLQQPAQDNPLTVVSSTSTSTGWEEFSKNVSGEWDGFGADFSKEGIPIQLPESVVPEAYREWEVQVFDWQTQCPTLAQPHEFHLMYKLIKLLPTVGCEADAATRYSVDERNTTASTTAAAAGDKASAASVFAYQSTGCYIAVWPISDGLLEVEHCLIDPQDRESRVRIIQLVRFENSKLQLQKIKVYCEQWYGPFRNGDQLGGCAIRDYAFASTESLKASKVAGLWQGLSAAASFLHPRQNNIQELVDEDVSTSKVRDAQNLVLLPKQLWCSSNEIEGGGSYCEVGWLFDRGQAITSYCSFSPTGELERIAIARETGRSEE